MTQYMGTDGDDNVQLDVVDPNGPGIPYQNNYALGRGGEDTGLFNDKYISKWDGSGTQLIAVYSGSAYFYGRGAPYFNYDSFEHATILMGPSVDQVQVRAYDWYGSPNSVHFDVNYAIVDPGTDHATSDGRLLSVEGGAQALEMSLTAADVPPGGFVAGPFRIDGTNVTWNGVFSRLQVAHDGWYYDPVTGARTDASTADDRIFGGNNDDDLRLGGGDNYAHGYGGDDIITSRADRTLSGSIDWKNEFWGDGGNDTLVAGGINDRIDGGAGVDSWTGNFSQYGQDGNTAPFTLTQGAGTELDTNANGRITNVEKMTIVMPLYMTNSVSSFRDGFASVDFTGSLMDQNERLNIDWGAKSAPITATLGTSSLDQTPLQLNGALSDGSETFNFRYIENFDLKLGSGDDTLDATGAVNPGNAWLRVTVDGGAGADTISAGTLNATLHGGAGDDVLQGYGELHGDDGDDRLTGAGILDGGAGNDVLTRQDNVADTLLFGGSGTDTVIVDGNFADYVIDAVQATSENGFDQAMIDPNDPYAISLTRVDDPYDVIRLNGVERLVFADKAFAIVSFDYAYSDEYRDHYQVNLTEIEARPHGSDATLSVEAGTPHVLTIADFGFVDPQGDALSAIIIDTLPIAGSLTLDGAAVTAGERIDAADIAAGLLRYGPPIDADGNVIVGIAIDSMTFRVADEAGDTSETANTLSIDVGVTHVTGTDGDDVISWVNAPPGQPFTAQYGPNYVDALGGNDSILTGDGNDIVFGGDGDDVIQTLGGDDIVYGGTGDDTIIAGFGNDLYDGGDGYDTVEFFGYFSDLAFDYDPSGTVTMAGPETGSQTLIGIERLYSGYTGASYIRDAATGEFVLEYAPPPISPVIGRAGTQTASSSGSDTLTGTAAAETFVIDGGASGTTGADSITGFGTNDVVIVTEKFVDRNEDGIITFGRNRKFDFDGPDTGTDSVAINGGAAKALRYLGEATDGYYTYALASVRPKHAKEGYIYSDDTLSGGAVDNKRDIFFADTALGIDLGHDVFANFGARDLLVTTTALSDPDSDGTVALSGGLDLADGGSIAVTGMSGASVDALTLFTTVTRAGVTYYLYGLPGSSHSAGELTF